MTENPAATLRRAATLMRGRAEAATPGRWERPLDTRHKDIVIAALPDGEQGQYVSGRIPAEWSHHTGLTGRYAGQRERVSVVSAAVRSIGGFTRKRSGRDLDYIASMHPLVGLAVADWLDDEAVRAAGIDAYEDSDAYPLMLAGFRLPLAVARAYLKENVEVPA